MGGRRPVLTGVYIHVLLADNLHTSISLSKSWWKFLVSFPSASHLLFPTHSSSFFAFHSQGWSRCFPVKFWRPLTHELSLYSVFSSLFPHQFLPRIKTPSFFCLGGKEPSIESYFQRAQWQIPTPSYLHHQSSQNTLLAATVIFSLDGTISWDLSFPQTCILILLSSPDYQSSIICQLQLLRLNSWRFGHYHTWLNMLLPIFCTPSSSYFDQFSVFFPGTSSASYR